MRKWRDCTSLARYRRVIRLIQGWCGDHLAGRVPDQRRTENPRAVCSSNGSSQPASHISFKCFQFGMHALDDPVLTSTVHREGQCYGVRPDGTQNSGTVLFFWLPAVLWRSLLPGSSHRDGCTHVLELRSTVSEALRRHSGQLLRPRQSTSLPRSKVLFVVILHYFSRRCILSH